VKIAVGSFVRTAPAGAVVAALCLSLCGATGLAGDTPLAADAPAAGIVTTLAGDGQAGLRDGPAREAQFVLPVALAYDRSGRLFVADQGAQRIRMLWHGSVTTVAGSGDLIDAGQYVAGGYQDGPALQARFNEPAGIAVASDGTIYVADELNHCIRRIENGNVTTFAGSPQHAGTADGPSTVATFTRPRALAVDGKNNLYVADYTVGIRKIDTSGTVTTLAMASPGPKQFVGVTTWGAGSSLVVFAVDNIGGIYRYRPGQPAETYSFGGVGPQLYGISATSEDAYLATDVRANVIRSLRLPQPPYVLHSIPAVVAGTALEDGSKAAGYRDGPVDEARFYNPFGIAISGQDVAIADTGNHRLRLVPLPDLRGPLGLGSSELSPDPTHYRILYVGLSHAFFNTGWSDSIPGRIESKLRSNRTQLGLARPPRLSVLRIDGGKLDALDDFVESTASDGQVDLVILSIVPEALYGMTLPPDTTDRVSAVRAMLRKLDAKLRAGGARLFVLLMPDSVISPVDGGGTEDPPPQNFNPTYLAQQRRAIDLLKGAGVPYYAALDDVLHYEQEGDRRLPLWLFLDRHPSDVGREFIAQEIVTQLAILRPWSSK
jgi:lysophospholipase L1-like esterase